jgi:hypothetical protein
MEHDIIKIIIVLICVGLAFYVIERAPFLEGVVKWGIMACVAILAIMYLL